MTMLMFNTFLRTVVMVTNRKKFCKLLEHIRQMYEELMMERDAEICRIMEDHTAMVLKISKINLIMGMLTTVGFTVFPIISEERAMFISYFMFAIAISKVLQYKLSRTCTEVSSKIVEGKIVECIKLHLRLISFIEQINELCGFIALMDFLLFVIVLCIMLLSFVLVKTVTQKCIITVYITMVFTQAFLLYYFSNEVFYESLEISTAAYDINWFDYDVHTQEVLKLLLLRSQKPCAILIVKSYPVNLRRLQVLIKITYSVFTLLEKVYG
ncbi:odorant receptor 30a-like [Musca domestica]|uniref:Odorant receptor 30a-like n=1 Tax=Musca domestica TaxID=7370 RepID=A0ABM3VKA4_MUSDO|nr:odorant receptor 30a-like [Musca domestica]